MNRMVYIVWEFHIKKGKSKEFERHYRGTGTWARLFRKSRGYRGTTLLKDRKSAQKYLLFDRWTDLASFRQFKKAHAREYAALDASCEELTESEVELGIFSEL